MGRPYRYIGRHLKVKFIQSLDGVVSKMYHADRKMTNTSRVLQLPTPSASSSLSGVSPSSCSLCGVQTETSQSSCRELPGTNSAPASFPLAGSRRACANPAGLSGENTQLATPRNTATETQSWARASRGQLSQWRFGEWRLPCALCQRGTKQHLQPTHKKSQCLTQTRELRLSDSSIVLPGYVKQIARARFLPTAMSSNSPAHGFAPSWSGHLRADTLPACLSGAAWARGLVFR